MSDTKVELYQSIMMKHFRNRQFRGSLAGDGVVHNQQNRKCGDQITLYWRLSTDDATGQGVLADCLFLGDGCSICLATASMTCHFLSGLSLDQAKVSLTTVGRFLDRLEQGQAAEAPVAILADLVALEELAKFPTRVACARLAIKAGLELVSAT